jgi:hypothetical protein
LFNSLAWFCQAEYEKKRWRALRLR